MGCKCRINKLKFIFFACLHTVELVFLQTRLIPIILHPDGVGDNINIMKTTFELNFDFYQAFKQHGYTKIWKKE